MSIDCFFKLREIDSLTKMRINHLKAISEQDDRLAKLNTRLQESHAQRERLKHELFSLQHELFDLEKKLKLLNTQRQNLMDIGETVERFTAPIDETETRGFELIEAIEAHERELQELKTFEAGLTKTLAEISDEAGAVKAKEEQEIKNLDLRLHALEEELPPDFRNLLKRVQDKKLAHGSFTRNENGHCFFCRFKISKVDESEIDLQQQLKLCPQCGRIFLPYGA